MAVGSRGHEDVEIITDAKTSPLEGWRHRRRVYLTLQAFRLPLFAAAGLVWWQTGNHYWAAGLVLISLPLPWIAVMLANEPGDPDKGSRSVYKPAVVRENRRRLAELNDQALSSGPPRPTLSSPDRPDIVDYEDDDINPDAHVPTDESEPSDDDKDR